MPTNTGVAPVCNAKAEEPSFATKTPSIPVFAVPNPGNPQSIVVAIQQLQAALRRLTPNALASPNNAPPISPPTVGPFTPGSGAGGGMAATNKNQQQPPQDWIEKTRVTQNVKVVNPDDDSQFVIVKEIVSITMEDPTTGVQMVIKRDP